MRLWLFVVLMAGFSGFAVAQEDVGLRISYDVGGAPVAFLRDGAGMVQVNGLDVPGLVMYRVRSKTVFYQHPDWPRWLVIGPEVLDAVAEPLDGVAGAAWTPFMDKPVRRWELGGAHADEGCGTWFGSPGVGAVAGLQADDFFRILSAVNWVNGGRQLHCHVGMPANGQGQVWGWPVRWQTEHVAWQLHEVVRVGLTDFVLPADVEPVTDEARLAIMLTQLTDGERAKFVREMKDQPLVQQVAVLEEMLGADGE